MFSKISTIVNRAVEQTAGYMTEKKSRYDKAEKAILDFCRKNELFIQKNMFGVGLINVIVYSNDPLVHANSLANTLDEESKGTIFDGYVVLKSVIAHEEFAIEVDSFKMVTVRRISRELKKLLHTYITGADKWMPPELEMIELLQKLYNPYSDRILDEVLAQIDSNLEKIEAVRGGAETNFYSANVNVFKESQMILLGEHAWELSRGKKPSAGGIVMFLSDYSPEETLERLENITTEPYNYREYDLMLPNNRNIRKYSIMHRGRTVAIFYNSTTYELIPYEIFQGVKVADAVVILKFLYVDLYVFRIVQIRQKFSDKEYDKISARTRQVIKHVSTTGHFYSRKWMGRLRNEHVENIKRMLQAPTKYYPYYPRSYHEGHAEYRKI